jgi:hypothetical protein
MPKNLDSTIFGPPASMVHTGSQHFNITHDANVQWQFVGQGDA